MKFMRHAILSLRAAGLLAALSLPAAAQALNDDAARVLKNNCQACHGVALQSSKLDLRSRESMLKGGERGAALVPGNAEASLIYRFAAALDQPSMPPGKKLAADDLRILKEWIDRGAVLNDVPPVAEDKLAALAKLEDRPILPTERQFWSFQPVRKPGAKTDIDTLWRGALAAKGLKPNPPATRRELIRRAYLDLTGLVPSPDEVTAFVEDRSPDAFAKVVERLLASPHYGERWGRHWLDLARYADSGGYEYDRDRPTAHLFRDWVVKALNDDMPYDRFVRLQIAGDEVEPGKPESTIATTFLRLGPEANIKTVQTRMDELDDILQTVGGSLLGMTVGCARCHNHKFDPIAQKDYYRMQAVFFNAKFVDIPVVSAEEVARHREAANAIEKQLNALRTEKTAIEKPYRDRMLEEKRSRLATYIKIALATPPELRTEGQRLNAKQVENTLRADEKEILPGFTAEDKAKWDAVKEKMTALEKQMPVIPTAMSVKEGDYDPSRFLHHGSPDSPGTVMKPGILSVAHDGEWSFPEGRGRRKAFAEWVTSPENPLTSRVMVNRLWQHHFGEGLVRTVSNFGKTGERPSHPELLDWLASEFVTSGWSLKAMHRKMMLSDAYQQSSADRAEGIAKDPENRLLWRQGRVRLEAEILRDNILLAAGTLNRKLGGPGVHPYIDPSLYAGSSGRTWNSQAIDDPDTWRRSIYIFQKRTIPVPMMELFDAPNGLGACSRRNRSTIATQALVLMNNAFVRDQAKRFAARLDREAPGGPEAQVKLAFDVALGRKPSDKELRESSGFLKSGGLLEDFAHAVFNLNEFAYAP